jgi:hypothetical protein
MNWFSITVAFNDIWGNLYLYCSNKDCLLGLASVKCVPDSTSVLYIQRCATVYNFLSSFIPTMHRYYQFRFSLAVPFQSPSQLHFATLHVSITETTMYKSHIQDILDWDTCYSLLWQSYTMCMLHYIVMSWFNMQHWCRNVSIWAI